MVVALVVLGVVVVVVLVVRIVRGEGAHTVTSSCQQTFAPPAVVHAASVLLFTTYRY